MKRTAIVTGVAGQDGSYMAERLADEGIAVIGYVRPESFLRYSATKYIDREVGNTIGESVLDNVVSFPIDSGLDWDLLLERLQPTYFFHFAGNSFVPWSWDFPVASFENNLLWTAKILESIRRCSPETRFLAAASSEMFAGSGVAHIDESTPIRPTTPYGISKAAIFSLVESYRNRYGLFLSSAILFNHESPRRSMEFVTRKISRGVAAIHLGHVDEMSLGSLDAARDWGYAPEYVDAMYRMMLLEDPTDLVIGTGRTVVLREVVDRAFGSVGLDYKSFVKTDPRFVRPADSFFPRANCAKADKVLNWKAKTTIEQLIEIMVEADIRDLSAVSIRRKNAA